MLNVSFQENISPSLFEEYCTTILFQPSYSYNSTKPMSFLPMFQVLFDMKLQKQKSWLISFIDIQKWFQGEEVMKEEQFLYHFFFSSCSASSLLFLPRLNLFSCSLTNTWLANHPGLLKHLT